MATVEAFRSPPAEARPYRTPPSNVEAEQALLGAILINNDAFDRVSDFLKSEHFIEEIHRRIYEIAGAMIRQGKLATPVTLKTFLGDQDLGGMTVSQYLARLATDATTRCSGAYWAARKPPSAWASAALTVRVRPRIERPKA